MEKKLKKSFCYENDELWQTSRKKELWAWLFHEKLIEVIRCYLESFDDLSLSKRVIGRRTNPSWVVKAGECISGRFWKTDTIVIL